MDERAQLAWVARRVGFGLAPGQLDEWASKGVDTVLAELTDPDATGVAGGPDPFAELARGRDDGSAPFRRAVAAWMGSVVVGSRPLESWMQLFWHDYFAVSAQAVRLPGLMFDHFELLRRRGLGNFEELLRAVTTDGAMLVFLDGTTSTGHSPNENYARELLELYSVGLGNFEEADVQAAAAALTGWVVRPRFDGAVTFVSRRHDDTPRSLLGVTGVHDVDTVVEVVARHPATAARVTRLLADRILGPGADPGVVARHQAGFAEGLALAPLVRGLLEDGLGGAATEVLVEPIPWLISAVRALQAPPRGRDVAASLRATGQVPFLPPNVGGFPPPGSYLSTSATVARFNLAAAIAEAARAPTPARLAAERGDTDALAEALGLVAGFAPATAAAISSLDHPRDRLAAALASPDLIVA